MTEDCSHAKASGRPAEINRLIAVQEAAQRHLDGLAAVGDADSTIATARVADLLQQQKAAAQAWSAAADQLAAAEKAGTTATIAAARTRYDQAYAEFARAVDAVIVETIHSDHAELDHLDAMAHHLHQIFDADEAMLDEFAARQEEPRTPPVKGDPG